MRYEIVHELPGRMRTRSGQRYFTRGQAYALEEHLPRLCPEIHKVEANATTGSLLMYYQREFRDKVLAALDSIAIAGIPEISPKGAAAVKAADHAYIKRLAGKIAFNLLLRLTLPVAWRVPLAVWRYLPRLKAGIKSLSEGRLDVPVLDAVSIGAGLLTNSYSAANSIMFLLDISDSLQEHVLNKTRHALSGSLALHIERVWLLQDGQEISVPLNDIKPGDCVVVRTGSLIPVDGVVEFGEAEVNESFMTGESTPAIKRKGISVFAGTTVVEGHLVIQVQKLNEETRINRIASLVESSEELKANIQTKAEHLADKIVPYSLLAALLTGLFTRNLNRAISVLMVDYSCALKLSTPIAVSAAMREAVNRGIVVKGGKYLEALAEADTIVFDKTGTLTTATPQVCKVIALAPYTEDEVLRTAACIEEHFPHSMARAIVAEAFRRNLKHEEEHAEVKFIVAHGVHTRIRGVKAVVGSAHYVLEDEQVAVDPAVLADIKASTQGLSVIYLGIDNRLAGCICLDDTLRPEAADVIATLKADGIKRVMMLTGDSEQAAAHVAKQLGIDEYRAQVLPENKADIIRAVKAEGAKVIMIGDGVNDSPAMSCADVAISMKDAADLAREVSDVTLLENTLESLIVLRQLSTKGLTRIHNNYRFIVGFNSGLIWLSCFGVLTPLMSASLHNISTVGVCAMSARRLLPPVDDE